VKLHPWYGIKLRPCINGIRRAAGAHTIIIPRLSLRRESFQFGSDAKLRGKLLLQRRRFFHSRDETSVAGEHRPRWTVKVPFAKSPKPTHSLSRAHTHGFGGWVLHEADNEKGGPLSLLLRKFNYNKLRMELSHAGARRFVFTCSQPRVTHSSVLMCGSRAVYTLMVDFEPAACTACSENGVIWWNNYYNKRATPAALI
jgi:hypothetical protein